MKPKTAFAALAFWFALLSVHAPAAAQGASAGGEERAVPWLRGGQQTGFPDQQVTSAVRFDKLEWNRRGGSDSARWDLEAYVGTDYDKFFFKSEGFYDGRAGKFDEAQLQALYSRMITYYFDLQVGVRHDFSPRPSRTYAVIGVEGLAPGFIEIDAEAYVSEKGKISGSFTAWHDLLITNRLILQPRIDVRIQAQSVAELGLGRGITDFELGARLRYEMLRNFAPYIGVAWDRKVGETAAIAEREMKQTSSVYLVAGLRLLW
ncbi:MAG: copper resistance protein B [Xanthobacteraceae bacterium]|nr:copper resistance protein B [Xanthobacteraceae bacterium]